MRNSQRRMRLKKHRQRLARSRQVRSSELRLGPKDAALAALAQRKKDNANRKHINNSSLPAGSPMYFYCPQCNGEIVLPEDYTSRQMLCDECMELENHGWL